jgi:hypothetical protein
VYKYLWKGEFNYFDQTPGARSGGVLNGERRRCVKTSSALRLSEVGRCLLEHPANSAGHDA